MYFKLCGAIEKYSFFDENNCEGGLFYIHGLDDKNFSKECYSDMKNLLTKRTQTSFLGNVYFTQYMQYHPCFTPDASKANLFVGMFWSGIWKFRSNCFEKLGRIIELSQVWNDINKSRHVMFNFWGHFSIYPQGNMRHWLPAVVAAKDCIDMDPVSHWVNRFGLPYPENSSCHVNNPHCSIAGACERSGYDRYWTSNCSFSNDCYLVAKDHGQEAITNVYYENLDKPIYQELPIVKPIEQRDYLVVGAWGVKRGEKKKAKILRNKLQIAIENTPGGKFFPIPLDSNTDRVEVEGYANSSYCVVPKGDSPSRRALSTCLILAAIPIVCSDFFVPPYNNL